MEISNMTGIKRFLKNLKFKRKIIGGIDETDVWKKIRELDELYQKEIEYIVRYKND